MDEEKKKDVQALIVSKKEELAELKKMAEEEKAKQLAEQKAGQIQRIKFAHPDKTDYGKASTGLALKPFMAGEDWGILEGMCFGVFGLIASSIAGAISGSWLVFFIAWLSIFLVGNGIAIPISKHCNKKQIRQTLGDPIAQFEYRIAKAIATFNSRADAYNHLLEGCKRGVIQKSPKDLEKIKQLLLNTRASLESKPELLKWLREADNSMPLSELPQMTLSLQEMEETERDLLESVEQLASADPQMRLLENEVASNELEQELKLLSEHTDQS